MDEQAKQVLGQIMILSIQHLFSMLSISGKTPDQIDQLLKEELHKFNERRIEDLPEPPK